MSAESLSTKTEPTDNGSQFFVISVLKFLAVVLLAMAIFLFSQVGVLLATGVITRVLGLSEEQREAILADTSYGPKLLVYAAITAVMVGLVVFVVRSVWFAHIKPQQQLRKALSFLSLQKRTYSFEKAVEVLGTYGFYFFTTLVVSVAVNALGVLDTSQPQDLGIAEPSNLYELGTIFVMLVILPPVGEEILFRGFLFRGLERYGSIIVSYVITSVLFGLAHAQFGSESGMSWNAVLDTMIFSVFLIHIMRRHESLYSAMLLHGIKNAVAFLILFGVNWL